MLQAVTYDVPHRYLLHHVARDQNIPLQNDPRLQEIHFGEWEGKSSEEIYADYPQSLTLFWENPFENPPPGGEKLADFAQRVGAAWSDIITLPHPTLVVCHGGTIRIIRGIVEQIPMLQAASDTGMPLMTIPAMATMRPMSSPTSG